jgi:hypothetical protein
MSFAVQYSGKGQRHHEPRRQIYIENSVKEIKKYPAEPNMEAAWVINHGLLPNISLHCFGI